jgi:guanylate kinase
VKDRERTRLGTGLLVVLSGPSGVGKGTVVGHAMSLKREGASRLRRSGSVTTRPRRADEREGVDYFFCSPEEFGEKIQAGRLLEWATYLGNRYGTPADWVDEQIASGHDVVLEIEVQGAMQVKQRRPESVLIYMLPPSWRALRRRLRTRRSESEQVQRERLAVARQEIKWLPQYAYCIVNDRVAKAASRLLAILEAERARVARTDLSGWLEGDDE